jgi:hypothetical protein
LDWLLIWFICGIISAVIGSRKGEGCAAFIIGVLLGPFGILFAIFSKGNRKVCSFCKELIHREATVCPHCQREVEPAKLQIVAEKSPSPPIAVTRSGALSNVERLVIVAILVVIAFIILYSSTKTSERSSIASIDKSSSSATTSAPVAQSTGAALSYTVLEQWGLPNGGFGRTIVVKANPTEEELRTLGEKLRQDTRHERNAFIFVYDDERAARNRLAAFSEKLPSADLRHHDRHQVAKYFRNANTGFHELDITPMGLDGPNVKVKY